ncbi:hypothetical protein ABIA60_003714 [Pseudomonas frederiksbergensis]
MALGLTPVFCLEFGWTSDGFSAQESSLFLHTLNS